MERGEFRERLMREVGRRMGGMDGGCGGRERQFSPRGEGGMGGAFGFGGGPRGTGGGGPFGGGPRGPRVRPGQLRLAILALLKDGPRNGYGLIQEIAQRSDGAWQPSPGSMYPALAQLEDEGLISEQPQEGKKAYGLTDAGRTYAAEHEAELKAVWDAPEGAGRGGHAELRASLHALLGAARQVAEVGSEAQRQQAGELLKETRRALYRLLAEDQAE